VTVALAGELTCKELVELVTDYLDGALSAADRTQFERHVRACAGCRAYLGQMRAIVRAAGRLAGIDLPPTARSPLLAAFRGWRDG
jgi:anti-sigma factor RsiW